MGAMGVSLAQKTFTQIAILSLGDMRKCSDILIFHIQGIFSLLLVILSKCEIMS